MNRRELILAIAAIVMLVGFLGVRGIGRLREGTALSLTTDGGYESELAVREAEDAILEQEARWRDARYHRVMFAAEDEITVRLLEDVTAIADLHEVRLMEVSIERIEEWFGLHLAHVDMRWTGAAIDAGAFFSAVIGGQIDWFVDDLVVRRVGEGDVDARLQARIPFTTIPLVTGGVYEGHVHAIDFDEDEPHSMGSTWARIFGSSKINEAMDSQPLPLSVVGVVVGAGSQAAILEDEQTGHTWLTSVGDTVLGWTVAAVYRDGVRMLDHDSGIEVFLEAPTDDQ